MDYYKIPFIYFYNARGHLDMSTSSLLFSQKVLPMNHFINRNFRITFPLNMHTVK